MTRKQCLQLSKALSASKLFFFYLGYCKHTQKHNPTQQAGCKLITDQARAKFYRYKMLSPLTTSQSKTALHRTGFGPTAYYTGSAKGGWMSEHAALNQL